MDAQRKCALPNYTRHERVHAPVTDPFCLLHACFAVNLLATGRASLDLTLACEEDVSWARLRTWEGQISNMHRRKNTILSRERHEVQARQPLHHPGTIFSGYREHAGQGTVAPQPRERVTKNEKGGVGKPWSTALISASVGVMGGCLQGLSRRL